MTSASPSVYTIPPGESFVHALARGLLAETKGDPMALADYLILLPNRRAGRALRNAFLRLSEGRPLLLPRLRALGDADEEELALSAGVELGLPPAIPSFRRQLLLAQLIQKLGAARDGSKPTAEQAVRLASELASLLDQVHTEGLSFDKLEDLVSEEYAAHWQITLNFLKIVTEHWPTIRGADWMDPAERRNHLMEAQAAAWEKSPPNHPVIAAGSTGSIPSTARLLCTVARLPKGRLVLPGLDPHMDKASWDSLLDPATHPQTHPQYGLARLLDRLGMKPHQVRMWADCRPSPRAWLISEAMRPAATTEAWRQLSSERPDAAQVLQQITRIDCPTPREEAGAIALILRSALEDETKTATLVTPDRYLARRVTAELRRYDIEIDDSAGQSLELTPPGAFLLLTAHMVTEQFAPQALLAALKHPMAQGGLAQGSFRARLRRLERSVLRGPRPAPGLTGLMAAVKATPDKLLSQADKERLLLWLGNLQTMVQPFADLMAQPEAPLADLLREHVTFAEAIAADDQKTGAERLWRADAGQVAADFVADLAQAADAMPSVQGDAYPGLLRGLMTGQMVRPPWSGHPRLQIWGPVEARVQHTDLMVLGGLNEGVWPPIPSADPWMSRPMRSDFGLPLPERRIGLSAHDFAQAFCAPHVVMTRSARVDGAPSVPSRWLMRLDAVLQACGVKAPWEASPWVQWHGQLDQPDRFQPVRPPAPRPPVEARPRQLSATAIETWMRDPYAIYARHILGLKALDPIDADPGAADYGDVVHRSLDQFLKAHPRGPLGDDALTELTALGDANFSELLESRPGLAAFWWPRFQRIAAWFISQERDRRAKIAEVHSELEGALTIAAPAGDFVVTARADRIDLLQDGTLALIDYKTGAPPTAKEVAAGYAPQLPIEGLIARHGGFKRIGARPVGEMLYWRLGGGNPGGQERNAGSDPERLIEEAMEGLAGLISAFDNPDTPYEARPHPDRAPKYSDYLHLARVKEWAVGGGEDGDA